MDGHWAEEAHFLKNDQIWVVFYGNIGDNYAINCWDSLKHVELQREYYCA